MDLATPLRRMEPYFEGPGYNLTSGGQLGHNGNRVLVEDGDLVRLWPSGPPYHT